MQLARVVGQATSTVKHSSLNGWKLLIVQPLMADARSPDGDPVLAVDRCGAGRGETVVVTSDGAATREMVGSETTPLRWTVLGIAD